MNGALFAPSTRLPAIALLSACLAAAANAAAGTCENATPGQSQLLWGDLHVHTAYSLDAYAFGAIATPKEAYAFGRGQPLRLANGEIVAIDRPLDFMAVTDHAETYDVMYICTDPLYRDDAYCQAIRSGQDPSNSRTVFNDYLLPLVSDVPPKPAAVCKEAGVDCAAASIGQWRRTRQAANDANAPCAYTALIGYEWTASPGGRHWHRNVIFRSDQVPNRVADYVHFPEVTALWRQLDAHCRAEDGCDVLTIPHNINWADGGPTFDVESATRADLVARARFERLAEIHQEKGNSECLPGNPEDASADCAFERLTDNAAKNRLTGPEDIPPEESWRRMRSTYYRSLLARGITAYAKSEVGLNPFMLGAIGSTDTHFGTPGLVSGAGYPGGVASLWLSGEERLSLPNYNPGGLVAVWAEENTRAGIFDALKARSAYATSGPRIKLRFGVTQSGACEASAVRYDTFMGETLPAAPSASNPAQPVFTVQAGRDRVLLHAVQIIKGELRDEGVVESTHTIATFAEGRNAVCISWQDEGFAADAPAYWYARVLEQPSPRWTKLLCAETGSCQDHPGANRNIRERAWSSPIWYHP